MERLFSVRGAVQLDEDSREEMQHKVGELMSELLERNGLSGERIVNVLFSQTQDLSAENPARAFRVSGYGGLPLFCTQEPSYPDTLERVVRVMLTYYQESEHRPVPVYLHGAEKLRLDLFENR